MAPSTCCAAATQARSWAKSSRSAGVAGGDRRLALQASSEPEHYARQAKTAGSLYLLVMAIALLTGIGAGFGAALLGGLWPAWRAVALRPIEALHRT